MLENNDILDSSDNSFGNSLQNALIWWEKKRILFNSFVGISGVVSIMFLEVGLSFRILIEILIWIILVNLFYCFGFLVESLDNYYLNKILKTEKLRLILFIIGTTIICTLTILANIYYDKIMYF